MNYNDNETQDHFTSMTQTSGSTPSSSTETLACFITHSWMASVMWGTTENRFIEQKSLRINRAHFTHDSPKYKTQEKCCTDAKTKSYLARNALLFGGRLTHPGLSCPGSLPSSPC